MGTYQKGGVFCFCSLVLFILSYLLTLAPSVSSADTFPDKRGRFTGCILPLFFKHAEKEASLRTWKNDCLPK